MRPDSGDARHDEHISAADARAAAERRLAIDDDAPCNCRRPHPLHKYAGLWLCLCGRLIPALMVLIVCACGSGQMEPRVPETEAIVDPARASEHVPAVTDSAELSELHK